MLTELGLGTTQLGIGCDRRREPRAGMDEGVARGGMDEGV
jgi:hypothetical protein